MENKLQRAILHTTGKYSEKDLKEYTPDQQEVVKAYMEAWDSVHVTVSNFLEGEYSIVGWPPEEEEKAKEAIYQME